MVPSPLSAMTQELVAAATGRIPADVVIRGGKVVNVFTREILSWDIAVKNGRIATVGDVTHCIGPQTRVVDATGFYLAPGFLDGHLHVESSMVSVTQFARAVLPRGTTAVFMDPHEIANVLGLEGVRLMVEEGRNLPLRVYATMPSCVPAAPGLEDAGATFGPQEVALAMQWENIVGLGEMMNFPGVLNGDDRVHGEIRATLEAGKPVTGHYALLETEKGLPAYAAAGICCCHESTRAADALARLRLGMYAMMREGSAARDVRETVKSLTENCIDSRRAVLVTDDTHPETLLSQGHMDHVLRRAISEGLNPLTAIQAVTLNTAECFGVSQDLGSIAPGRWADIVFLSDLAAVKVEKVMVAGREVAESGKLLVELPTPTYPDKVRNSVRLKEALTAEHFMIPAPSGRGSVRVHIIQVLEGSILTRHVIEELEVEDGQVKASPERDIAKVAVVERHRGTGTRGLGLVRGFGFKAGALASTVAHDSHNLIIVGTNEADMALAGNTLAQCGGGMAVVKEGRILALLPLPIAGLMSDQPVEIVARQVEEVLKASRELGCEMTSPFMTMAFVALPVIPELRLTNRGLVDVLRFDFVPVIAE
ncbi:adenine deaminase [Moorellaceae bacterium AZ2]